MTERKQERDRKTRVTFLYMAMKEESFKIVPHNAYFINMSETKQSTKIQCYLLKTFHIIKKVLEPTVM